MHRVDCQRSASSYVPAIFKELIDPLLDLRLFEIVLPASIDQRLLLLQDQDDQFGLLASGVAFLVEYRVSNERDSKRPEAYIGYLARSVRPRRVKNLWLHRLLQQAFQRFTGLPRLQNCAFYGWKRASLCKCRFMLDKHITRQSEAR